MSKRIHMITSLLAAVVGSVLGNRLTEDKDKEVLVLEAGRSDYPWDLFIQMPAALMFPSGNRFTIGFIKRKKNRIWDVK